MDNKKRQELARLALKAATSQDNTALSSIWKASYHRNLDYFDTLMRGYIDTFHEATSVETTKGEREMMLQILAERFKSGDLDHLIRKFFR